MKKLFVVTIGIMFGLMLNVSIAMTTETYEAITPDNTVQDINLVKVQRTLVGNITPRTKRVIENEILTLSYISTRKQVINALQASLQDEENELNRKEGRVRAEANKVILYVPPEEP